MMWEWEEGSILYNCTPAISPKEIFQAVCNEVGRYYGERGMKYTKSNRKLKWQGEKLRCEFVFWSSHSNIRGEWVNFEIVISIYALDKFDMEQNGLLYFRIKPRNFNVYGIDNEQFYRITDFIDNMIEYVRPLENREGLVKYFEENSKQDFIDRSPNDRQYLSRFGLEEIAAAQ